jgi:NurA-like 5'-3' nuclease
MTSEFSIVVYGGEEYYISVDGHRKLGDIGVKIYEDDKNRTQLYSNAEFNYEQFFYFKISRTRKLIIEISTEEPENGQKSDEKYCLGVLIEFRDNKSSQDRPEDVGF